MGPQFKHIERWNTTEIIIENFSLIGNELNFTYDTRQRVMCY